jgi:heterodisulfide reductase subunit A2
MLEIAIDENDFYTSGNEEFDPVSSSRARIFMAGAALGPKDIPETVAQASGAAAKVLSLFQREKAGIYRA